MKRCEICRQIVSVQRPAELVVVRRGNGHYGADVHVGNCQKDRRVVHGSSGAPLLTGGHGFIRRGH